MEKLLKFNEGKDSKSTKKQIRYSLSVFRDFCKEIKPDFDDDLVDNEALDLDLLFTKFFAGHSLFPLFYLK